MDELQYLEKYLKYKQKYFELEHGGSKVLSNLPKSPFNRSLSSPIGTSVTKSQQIIDNTVSINKSANKKKLNLDLKTSQKKFEPSEVIKPETYKQFLEGATYTTKGKLDEKKAIKRIVGSVLIFVSQELLKMIKMFYADNDIKSIIMNQNLSTQDNVLLESLQIPLLYQIAIGFITHCYNLQMYIQNGLEITNKNTYIMKTGRDGKTNYNNLKSELESLIDGVYVEQNGKQVRQKGQITIFSSEKDSFTYYSQEFLKKLIEKLLKVLEEYKNKDNTAVAKIIKEFLEGIKKVETLEIETTQNKKNINSIKTMSELEVFLKSIKTLIENDISAKLLEITEFQRNNKFSPKIQIFETTINSFISLVRCSVTLGSMQFKDLYDINQDYYLPELKEIESIYKEAMEIHNSLKDLLTHDNMKITKEQEQMIDELKLELAKTGSNKASLLNRLINNNLSLKHFFNKEQIPDEVDYLEPETIENFDEESLRVLQEGKVKGKLSSKTLRSLIHSINTPNVGAWIYSMIHPKSPRPTSPLAEQIQDL